MHSGMIGGVGAGQLMRGNAAPSPDCAKAPEDGRFRAAMAGDANLDVGKTTAVAAAPWKPEAALRPMQQAAPVAVKGHESEHARAGQDTGAVVVARQGAHKQGAHKQEPGATDEQDAPAAAEPEAAATQTSGQPAPAALPAVVNTATAPVEGAHEALKEVKTAASPKASGREVKTPRSAPDASLPETKSENVTVNVPVPMKSAEIVTASVSSATPSATGVVAVHGTHAVGTVAKLAEVAPGVPKTAPASPQPSDLQTLMATPNVLEVGIASGTHGWLRVRAELGQTGEVTASVAASSTSAAAELHKELPAISAYLATERVTVSSLVVNALDKGSDAQDAAMNQGKGTQSGAQRERRQASSREPAKASGRGVDFGVDFGFGRMNLPAAVYANGSGSWLSVRV